MRSAGRSGRARGLFGPALLGVLCLARPILAGVNTWTTNGPEGGTVVAFAFDPTNSATVYAGTNGGGVFKTHERRRNLDVR